MKNFASINILRSKSVQAIVRENERDKRKDAKRVAKTLPTQLKIPQLTDALEYFRWIMSIKPILRKQNVWRLHREAKDSEKKYLNTLKERKSRGEEKNILDPLENKNQVMISLGTPTSLQADTKRKLKKPPTKFIQI